MLYFTVTTDHNGDNMAVSLAPTSEGAQSRWDWKTYDHVRRIAALANKGAGKELYLGIDRGAGNYPRFDVIPMPQIGDEVSYGFNGDYYPCGKIVSISATLKKITTSTGDTFYRRRETGRWVKGGTWTLVQGHRSEQNPCF